MSFFGWNIKFSFIKFSCMEMAEGIKPYVDIVEGNSLWSLDTLVSVGRNILVNFFNVDNQW